MWLRYYQIQTWDTEFTYSLLHYIALNTDHFPVYKQMESLIEKIKFLEEMLYKHINLFAQELRTNMPVPLTVKILSIKEEKYIEYKDVFHLTFNLTFKSNLLIPEYVGIGKGVSVGFGIVKQIESRS